MTVPAHDAGLTILPKKKKKTLKVTKLTSCMNFRMIQAVIKCFERSTVERIEENSNVSCCIFLRCKYGHCEKRNKTLIILIEKTTLHKDGISAVL